MEYANQEIYHLTLQKKNVYSEDLILKNSFCFHQETGDFLLFFTLISTLPKLARGLSECARSSYRNNY